MTTATVTGKTFDHRDRLKDLGGRWDANDKNWKFDFASSRTIDQLKMLPGCLVTTADAPKPKPRPNPISATDYLRSIGHFKSLEHMPQVGTAQTVFYGDSKNYYNRFKDKNPISFFGFSSLSKMVDLIEAIPEHKRTGIRDSGHDTGNPTWYGTPDMSAALKLARNGWSEGVESAAKIAAMLHVEHATQRRRAYGVAGGRVSVGRMLAGNPSHMVRRPKRDGSKVITLFVQNNGSAQIKGETLIARSAVVCALIDIIEANGYSCELVSVTTDYARVRSEPSSHTVVTLKHAGEKLNLNSIAFALGHPSFFRRFIFALVCQADELRDCWATQGFSTEAFNSHYMPEKGEYYITHLKENITDVREMLEIIKPDGLPIEIGS